MRTTAIVVILVVLGLLAWWVGGGLSFDAADPQPGSRERAVNAPAQAVNDPEVSATDRSRHEVAGGDARDAVEVPTATTGSLLLTVVFADDKKPAPAIDVSLYRGGVDTLFEQPRGRTDAEGRFLFEDLAPGKVTPATQRGEPHWGKSVVVVAGGRVEATLELPLGMTARGRVVDGAGAAVPGADIVVTGWGGGSTQVLAQSGPDGAFALRAVAPNCHIGARKAGYRPSSMRTFTASEGAVVDFTIVMTRDGGGLRGVVQDPHGQPVAGAVVRAGDTEQNNHKLPDGASAMGPQPETVRTDAQGRFEFASVVPGKVPVAARAPGLAPWTGTVAIAPGRVEELVINLQPGATLFGVVRDDQGQPLAKVDIDVMTAGYDELRNRGARTAADGTFRLEGLGAGPCEAIASHDELGRVTEKLQFVAGEVRRWDPVMSGGLQLLGRVLDADGKPVAKVMIEAMLDPSRPGDRFFGFVNSGEDGEFAIKNCLPDRALRLTFRRKSTFPELTVSGVLPGREPLTARLPAEAWVFIEGKVLGPDGSVPTNVDISPYLLAGGSGSPVEKLDPASGAFRIGPYPPGGYGLSIQTGGYPAIRLERTLGPDEVWNVGELRFAEGGVLVAHVVAAVAGELEELSCSIRNAAGKWIGRPEVSAGSVRSSPLAAGEYTLQVAAKGLATTCVPFTIRAGAETRLDVPLREGVRVEVRCTVPATRADLRSLELTARDADGVVAWRQSCWRSDGVFTASATLASGRYTIEASAEGLAGTATLDAAAATNSATIEMR
ncbi:MAG: carboxypeptidase-like regulatory domain-containing protein [Planctomycetota bacterium]